MKKKPNPNVRAILVPFKINAEEMRNLLKLAHGYAKGNVSKYIRAAIARYHPKKEDFKS